jgi:hypothetical protein
MAGASFLLNFRVHINNNVWFEIDLQSIEMEFDLHGTMEYLLKIVFWQRIYYNIQGGVVMQNVNFVVMMKRLHTCSSYPQLLGISGTLQAMFSILRVNLYRCIIC